MTCSRAFVCLTIILGVCTARGLLAAEEQEKLPHDYNVTPVPFSRVHVDDEP